MNICEKKISDMFKKQINNNTTDTFDIELTLFW